MHKILTIGVLGLLSVGNVQADELLDSTKVHVAFRTVEDKNLLGGVSAVDVEKLMEKDYSTYSLSDMQALVGGYNGQLWNQGDVLVLVDGVPRDANNILPSEIAQISFLKGAQAVVLYGSRGAHGMILITTKRGNEKNLQVSVRGNAQLFVPKSYPKYLGRPNMRLSTMRLLPTTESMFLLSHRKISITTRPETILSAIPISTSSQAIILRRVICATMPMQSSVAEVSMPNTMPMSVSTTAQT